MPVTATWRAPLRFAEADAITEATPQLLARVVAADPARIQVIDASRQATPGPAKEVTGAELFSAVAADQARLRAAGAGPGDVVCVQLPNWWEAVSLAHAVWGMGATLCPVPVNYRAAEISAILAATPVAAFVAPAWYRGTEYRPIINEAMQRSGVQVPLLTVREASAPVTASSLSSPQSTPPPPSPPTLTPTSAPLSPPSPSSQSLSPPSSSSPSPSLPSPSPTPIPSPSLPSPSLPSPSSPSPSPPSSSPSPSPPAPSTFTFPTFTLSGEICGSGEEKIVVDYRSVENFPHYSPSDPPQSGNPPHKTFRILTPSGEMSDLDVRTAVAGEPRTDVGRPELDADLDEVCLLMFTSGTTGRPKGVLHSHRTLLADARSIADLYRMDRDRVYMPSPVGHITGLVYGVLMPLLMNGVCVLQAEWDPRVGAELIEEHGCTVCVGATPFLRGLTDAYREGGGRSALRAFICGGADVPPSLVSDAEQALGATVARAYGLTEMPTVTCGGPDDPETVRTGTDGRLTGSSQARLNETGELEVRGPELCLGYLDPADNAAAFTSDGWFRTGDLATLGPDGSVTIIGRAKDIVVRGGENISVKEVEDYLAAHPLIADVAIVAVPDEVLGERACAFVVAADRAPSLKEISGYLAAQGIARQKLPEHLIVVDALPRTLSGKIQKFLLREDAVRLLAAGRGESR